MRMTHQLSLIPVFEKLLNNAPLAVCSSADEHTTASTSILVQIVFLAFLCLREPALTQAALGDIAIDPETKLDGTASTLGIDPVWSYFETFLPDAINAIFEELADFMAVADKVKVTFQVGYVIGVNMLMKNHVLLTMAGQVLKL